MIYSIINIEDLSLINFSEIVESNENTIRKSLDESQFGIKYRVEPSFISDGSVVPVQILNHDEAISLMDTDKWSEPYNEE